LDRRPGGGGVDTAAGRGAICFCAAADSREKRQK